jgi:serine protease Do
MAGAVNRVFPESISSGSGASAVMERLRRVTVQILGRDGGRGAGVVWTADGLIVTNAHVADGSAMVRLHDGRIVRAELVGRHPPADLAALRIPLRGLAFAELRESQTLRPGELVIAIGHPREASEALSMGIVHAASADAWVEADIRLAPGNSGGPLADAAGRVVGINSMVANGMGIAVSTAAIREFLWRGSAATEGAA